jgi:hypothetical protein
MSNFAEELNQTFWPAYEKKKRDMEPPHKKLAAEILPYIKKQILTEAKKGISPLIISPTIYVDFSTHRGTYLIIGNGKWIWRDDINAELLCKEVCGLLRFEGVNIDITERQGQVKEGQVSFPYDFVIVMAR